MRPLATVFLVGCGGPVDPPGGCPSTKTGEIACYSVPGPDDQWVLDCDHPLDRTYWRVFLQTDGTAYLIPRPDGAGLTWGLCDGSDAALAALFGQHGLCEPTLDAAGVEAINALPLDDALAISHALHERLTFGPVQTGEVWDITPWPLPEDLEVACPGTSAAAACETWLEAVCGGSDLGVVLGLDEDQATELAAALDAAYGIGG